MENIEFEKSNVFDFNSSIDYAKGAIVSKIILKKATGNVTLFSFDKGQELSEHTAQFDALIQIIEGTSDIIIEGINHSLISGQSIILPANSPHAVKATGKFKMILTMIKSH